MALASTTVWECRANATASNVNGGGFNPSNTGNSGGPGTDWSQQTAAQYNLTAGSAAGVGATLAYAAAAVDMCGNIAHLVSGTNCTTGLYEIVSVVAGVSITLDRNCTTGVTANAAVNVGGAMSLQSTAGFTDSNFFNALIAGNKVWMRGGATNNIYSIAGQMNMNTATGTATANIAIEGYASTRGDRPTGSTRPTYKNTVSNFIFNTDTNLTSIIFTGNISSQVVNSPNRGLFLFCSFIATSTTANAVACFGQPYGTFINCEFVSYRGIGFQHNNDVQITNCYFHDSDIGIVNANNGSNYGIVYSNNIFDSMVTAGIKYTNASTAGDVIQGNTFFGGIGNKTGTGIIIATGSGHRSIFNNIFYGLSTGISVADASGLLQGTSMWSNWNDFFSNTTDVSNITKGAQDVALDPKFANVSQLTGTAGVVSGSTLTVASATGIVANQDFVYIISGTGVTAGQYLITGVAGTVLTLSSAPGGSGTNINYQITTGRNFNANGLNSLGALGTFPGGLSKGYQNIGAVQSVPTLAAALAG
jgi:hypothetical protein